MFGSVAGGGTRGVVLALAVGAIWTVPVAAQARPELGMVGAKQTKAKQKKSDICPRTRFPRDLNRVLARLPGKGDPDGDGFTTREELKEFAFDPRADAGRFNPLIADVPRIGINLKDLSLALATTLSDSETKEVTNVVISEDETTQQVTDSETTTTLEGHQVGAGVEGSKAGVTGKVEYQYTNQTTEEERRETSNTTRNLNRSEVSQHFSKTQAQTIDSASLAMTARIRNRGNVAFKVTELAPILVSVGVDGSRQTFDGFKQAGDGDNQPSLAPGETAEIVYTIGDIGAVDAIALAQDASSLRMSVGAVKLSQIGIDGFQADSGDFARYADRIKANTAAVSLDLRAGRLSQTHLVSTSFRRDRNGRPAGTTLCDALQLMLGRKLKLSKRQPVKFGNKKVKTRVLTRLTDGAGGAVKVDRAQYFVLDVTPAAVRRKKVFAVPDVVLRGGQAARIATFRDADSDGVEAREERAAGSDDAKKDTDGDGLSDFDELTVVRTVTTEQPGDPAVRGDIESVTVKRRTSPLAADTDGDGATDTAEVTAGTDPELVDTDGDGARDPSAIGGDTAPLAMGPMFEYRFDGEGWLQDTQGGLPLGPRPGCSPFDRAAWTFANRSGTPDTAVKTIPGDSCNLLVRSSWATPAFSEDAPASPRGLDSGAYTVMGWVYTAPAGSVGAGKQRIQWMVGQPGGLIVELEERNTDHQYNVVQSNCTGNEVSCQAKSPVKITLGPPYNTHAGGQWSSFALIVWPGKSGDTLGTNIRLRINELGVAETFVPSREHGQTNGCVVIFGARSGSCDGADRFTGGDTATLGLPIDDVRVYRYALTDDQLAAALAG